MWRHITRLFRKRPVHPQAGVATELKLKTNKVLRLLEISAMNETMKTMQRDEIAALLSDISSLKKKWDDYVLTPSNYKGKNEAVQRDKKAIADLMGILAASHGLKKKK